MKQKIWSAHLPNILFWLISITHIFSIILNLSLLGYISKPLIMITLGLLFIARNQGHDRRYPLLVIFFSWLGDIFLMLQNNDEIWFLTGLGAFLIAQILYVISFRKYQFMKQSRPFPFLKPLIYTILILYAMILWSKLYPALGNYKLPVTIYTLAILTMTLSAAARIGRTSISSYILGLTGAFLFLISDSLIALNKFLLPVPDERLLIMSTYILGQYLIINGLIRHP